MLFAAFEKHQYYNIKDLVKLTNQPVVRKSCFQTSICTFKTLCFYRPTSRKF
jgi:transcription initiation factor TFIIF subunit beta